MFRQFVSSVCVLTAFFLVQDAPAQTVRGGDMIGRVVVTPQGELLGRVEDFALDLDTQQIKFIVVSVGSYLIEDNLVAVAPGAIGQSSEGEYLVVNAQNLDQARRFGAGNWPDTADVLPAQNTVTPPADEQITAQLDREGVGDRVLATISDGQRIATLEGQERKTVIAADPASSRSRATEAPVQRKTYQGARKSEVIAAGFTRLDRNNDGYLSPGEASVLLRDGRDFADFDLDGNQGIDPFEYRAATD
ncbi:MAG: PRC-barrel domain-containing protein [Pseudomonadota bacterium]